MTSKSKLDWLDHLHTCGRLREEIGLGIGVKTQDYGSLHKVASAPRRVLLKIVLISWSRLTCRPYMAYEIQHLSLSTLTITS
jgi:hypothetical protein